MEQKNKKLIAIIGIIAACLVVFGVAGAMNARRIANTFKEKTSSPEEYYRYVEEKNRDASLKQMDTSYGNYRDAATKQKENQKITYEVALGDTLKALASGYGLESAKIETTSKMQDSVLTNHTLLQLNGKDAANMNTYLDYSSKEGYLQIPEVSSSYLDLTSTLQEAADSIPMSNLYLTGADLEKYFPETGKIDKLITTYSDIVLKNIKKVKRSSVSRLSRASAISTWNVSYALASMFSIISLTTLSSFSSSRISLDIFLTSSPSQVTASFVHSWLISPALIVSLERFTFLMFFKTISL